jgi:hypothetical protein
LRNDGGCRISILYARGGRRQGNNQAHRIDDEVALSTFDLLGCIETALATLRRVYALRFGLSRTMPCASSVRRMVASHTRTHAAVAIQLALDVLDGIDWSWLSMDGAMT